MFRFFRYFLIFILPFGLFPSEIINDIVAIVAKTPITYLDLKNEIQHLEKKRRNPNDKDYRNVESRALDNLIENAIVDEVVKQEVISVPDKQVDETIKTTMENNGIPDEKTFEKVLIEQTGMTLDDYKDELRKKLKIRQIIQLKISLAAPREDEVRQFYNAHKNEIGSVYQIKVIYKGYDPNNPKQELSVSKEMGNARTEAMFNFDAAMAKYSDDKNGGNLGWLRLDQILQKDAMMANIVSRMKKGDVSMVFVSSGRYYLVKVENMRPVSFEEATPMILQRLYGEKQENAYENWLEETKKTTSIKIFLKNYQERK